LARGWKDLNVDGGTGGVDPGPSAGCSPGEDSEPRINEQKLRD